MARQSKKSYSNLYEGFIDILRNKEGQIKNDTNLLLHKHHVHPKHDGGSEDGEVVICTARDHARAHYIRWKVFGQTYDLCAYYGLVKKEAEKQRVIQQQIIKTNRQRGNVMFNNQWQKIMASRPKSSYHFQQNPGFASQVGRKGGKIGGKTMTPTKAAVLQQNGFNVGTNHGRKGGLKHQNPLTKRRLSMHLEWKHESGVQTISPPFESVRELQEYLNCFVSDSVKHTSGLSEILRNVQPTRYGWRISKELEFE